jgi:hypothetical protein
MTTTRDKELAERMVDALGAAATPLDHQRAARILSEYREEILKPFEGAALFLRPEERELIETVIRELKK